MGWPAGYVGSGGTFVQMVLNKTGDLTRAKQDLESSQLSAYLWIRRVRTTLRTNTKYLDMLTDFLDIFWRRTENGDT